MVELNGAMLWRMPKTSGVLRSQRPGESGQNVESERPSGRLGDNIYL